MLTISCLCLGFSPNCWPCLRLDQTIKQAIRACASPVKAYRLRFPPWGLRPVQGVCARATAQLHQSIPHLHFTLHKCHEGLWLPKRANIPCLSKHLEACHSFVPGIPVPLSCPHVRATASIPKHSGPPAPLIQVAGRMPHFGLPPHSPSLPENQSVVTGRHLLRALSHCCGEAIRKRQALLQHEGHKAISPLCLRGWRRCHCAPPG